MSTRCRGPLGRSGAVSPGSPAPASAFFIGSRTTTGGIGREPGMLMRIRVVSVVSVRPASGDGDACSRWSSPSPGAPPAPGDAGAYGWVPEG
ncbi:hypothetical protein [Phaeacidiphilus oryzae]|uniref:hypothetical protein n=1 Tax=Phaeacidiphilus oryzae TaxID=348818 RepID=UPI001269F509|nr:hypothetical protein [Phaeacidiphilus oryzae]